MVFDMKAFGVRVKQLRRGTGLTQEQLAEILNISVSHLGKIEIGHNAPSIELILEMAGFFGVSTDALLRGENSPDRECGSVCSGGSISLCPLMKCYT